jgi:hypothetical protein
LPAAGNKVSGFSTKSLEKDFFDFQLPQKGKFPFRGLASLMPSFQNDNGITAFFLNGSF